MYLIADKISKRYQDKALLEDVSFTINEGDKIGVIGLNGAGKSTLLKIIAGRETPDSGSVTRLGGLRVGYLPQNPEFTGDSTVLEQAMEHASGQRETKDYECRAMLTRLGVTDFEAKVSALSGGQKRRLSIACTLAAPLDLLILDEPTNHIDNATIEWLEGYLKKCNCALFMVTHDRYFLDRVTDQIFELQNGSLYTYACNYSAYLERKAEREEMEAASERKRQSLLKKELAWMLQGPKARGTKQQYRVDRYEEMSAQKADLDSEALQMSSMSSRLGRKIIEVDSLNKRYGDQVLLKDFSYRLLRRDRIGIVGPNGAGKTTLLKMILGSVEPDSGTIEWGQTVKLGYFSQESGELDLNQKVVDYIRNIASEVVMPDGKLSAVQMLERFLFPSDLQYSTIGRLSGGERRRLVLLGILMQAPNVLLFDEPTNDLDTQTLMVLEDYLDEFAGAVIAVSHDRYFLDRIAEDIFAFQGDGSVKTYIGGYSDYIEQRNAELRAAAASSEKPDRKAEQVSAEGESRSRNGGREKSGGKLRFSFNEQREYDSIDSDIAKLEEQLCVAEEELVGAVSDYVRLQELTALKEELEKALAAKMERWVYLNDLAERIEAQANS